MTPDEMAAELLRPFDPKKALQPDPSYVIRCRWDGRALDVLDDESQRECSVCWHRATHYGRDLTGRPLASRSREPGTTSERRLSSGGGGAA